MPVSKEDKILIKILQECKGYNAWQQFLNKGWTKNSINREISLEAEGSIDHQFCQGCSLGLEAFFERLSIISIQSLQCLGLRLP